MAAAFVSNAAGINLDASIASLSTPFVAASGFNVIHIGIRGRNATVLSVTDDAGTPNVYTKRASTTAVKEIDFAQGHYTKGASFEHGVEAESWTATVSAACKNVIVTLTSGEKFAVECNNYSSSTGIGTATAASASFASTSAPTISLTPAASTSIASAGFVSATLLNQAAGTGTLRGNESGATVEDGIAVTTVDNTGTTPIVVSLNPVNQETVDGATFDVPATYAITVVEIKA